ncbi:hypothetical protein BDC45DRAFT_308911 [Circinella umbellata]|nr:hypothetical protein BDC45DRAFT_308911 [Circinella umbellata]
MTRNSVFPSASSLCQTYQLPQELQVKQLQEHFKNGIQELSGNTTGNGGKEAVMHFTNSIQEINATILATCFLHRATAYELQDRQDLALKDIYQSILHSPQSSAGYIHAYNLLVSSNQLRQGLLAINQGVHQVSPRDSKFAALRYMKDALLAEIDKRNSLPVPYDIVTEILHCLSFRDRVRLSTTCKYWQRMLRDSPPVMWHDIDIRKPMGQEQFQRLLGHVESNYVRQIKVDTKELLSQVIKMKWHHIRSLDTETIEVDDVDLIHVLTHNKDTLQQLNVSGLGWIIERTAVFMANVIKTCSNLTHLTIHTKLYKEQRTIPLTDLVVEEEEEVVAQQSTPATTRRRTTKKQERWSTPLIFLSITEAIRQNVFQSLINGAQNCFVSHISLIKWI